MSSFAVNPHTLRTAARVFAGARTGLETRIARFSGQAGDAGAATGDAAAARSYGQLFDLHLGALHNLQESLGRISEALLYAALAYDQADEDVVITGVEQP